MRTFNLVLLGIFLLAGCRPPKVVTRAELQEMIHEGHYSDMWRGTYYCGTEGANHYIVNKIDLARDQMYRIATNELRVLAPFPLTHDPRKFVALAYLQPHGIVNAGTTSIPMSSQSARTEAFPVTPLNLGTNRNPTPVVAADPPNEASNISTPDD